MKKTINAVLIISMMIAMPVRLNAFTGIDQQLSDIFSESEKIEKRDIVLNREETLTVYTGITVGKVDGYAFFVTEQGKHGPIDFIVVISSEGIIERMIVHQESEIKGKKIKKKRFLKQFIGKKYGDPFKKGKDVNVITGATISSRAAIRAAKRALLVWKSFIEEI